MTSFKKKDNVYGGKIWVYEAKNIDFKGSKCQFHYKYQFRILYKNTDDTYKSYFEFPAIDYR